MPYGFNGKLLRVNLTNRYLKVEEKSNSFYKRLLGRRNVAAYLMLQEISPEVKPLDPEVFRFYKIFLLYIQYTPLISKILLFQENNFTGF